MDFGTDYTDFGARLYSPVIRRWVTPDPMSEDYYGISAYAYCAGDPVNFVDPDGRAVYFTRDGKIVADDGIKDNKAFFVPDNMVATTVYGILLERICFKDRFEEIKGALVQHRFEEGPNYTISTFETIGGEPNITGYMLEPGGPDTTIPNQNKRIPEGVYKVDNYHSAKYKNNYILFNDKVSKSRKILYHVGNSSGNTEGCNLPGTSYDSRLHKVWRSGDKLEEIRQFFEKMGVNNVRIIIINDI